MDLTKAKVLVTGGSSGIGKAVANLLKQRGAEVVIAARNAMRVKVVAEELGVHGVAADVGKEADVVELVKDSIQAMGGLNVLINNAGYGYMAPLLHIEAEPFEQVWRTNVLGAALCAREAARYFVEQEDGHIINVGSTASMKGSPNSSPYVATKHALRGMTESWRNELRWHNIRVMQVNPSEVMTHFADNRHSPGATGDKKVYTDLEKDSKLTAEEVAHTIAALLEMDNRGFITEATIFATNPKV